MVSISPVSAANFGSATRKTNNSVSFKGMRLPDVPIRNAADAIEQWQRLADSAYTALSKVGDLVMDNAEMQLNSATQRHNFEFLDKLVRTEHKATFIDAFKKHTGFPNLQKVGEKIVGEFDRVTNAAQETVRSAVRGGSSFADDVLYEGAEIVFKGYQPSSSAHIGRALPGSDLNGAFVIFKGSSFPQINTIIRKSFFKTLADDTDSRILSFAHFDARPKILSLNEVIQGMNEIDEAGNRIVDSSIPGRQNFFARQRMRYGLYTPQAEFDNPSMYNVALSKALDPNQRLFAKDLAVVLEGVRDGIHLKREAAPAQAIAAHMQGSTTGWCSNIFQTHVLEQGLGGDIAYKPKLESRNQLRNFDNWSVDKQYDAVKAIIKGMTDDGPRDVNSAFTPMVSNNDVVSASQQLLDYSLLNGRPFLG